MQAPTRTKILAVDDREENLVAVRAVLESHELEVVCAHSGREALRHLLTEDFAVILLDVQMPGLDGFETAELIKQRERTRHIPIIFLTAHSTDLSDAMRGYTVGAVDYLPKPMDPHILRSKVGVFVELHHLRRRAEELAHRALHDPLTGLPNRTLFHDRLEMALAREQRRSEGIAVLFCDLDGFKDVNDRLGHDAGDELLVQVADRMRRALRPADTVARLGGDEFTVLSEDLVSELDAAEIAGRIQDVLCEPFVLAAGGVSITPSIGVAFTRTATETPQQLIRAADSAMYRAKRAGGARVDRAAGSVAA